MIRSAVGDSQAPRTDTAREANTAPPTSAWRSLLAPPAERSAWFRWLLLLANLAVALLAVVALAFASAANPLLRGGAGLALLLLCWWLGRAYLLGAFPLHGLPLEALAVPLLA